MLVFLRSKHETITRTYDIAGSGFSPLPNKTKDQILEDEKFHTIMGDILSKIILDYEKHESTGTNDPEEFVEEREVSSEGIAVSEK